MIAPQLPTILFGMTPLAALAEHDRRLAAATVQKGRGRGIRQDTHTMTGIVLSHPVESSQLAAPQIRSRYEAWRDDAVSWCQDEATRRDLLLLSVIEHLDETHPHLHALFVARNSRCDVRLSHPGHLAKAAATPERRRIAYIQAMRQWQDEIYISLSARHGHARLGPKRRRLSRGAWQAEQAIAASVQAAMNAATQRQKADQIEDEAAHLKHALAKAEADRVSLRAAAEDAILRLRAVEVAVQAFLDNEIIDAKLNPSPEQSFLIFSDGVAAERIGELVRDIDPEWPLATNLVKQLADLTRPASLSASSYRPSTVVNEENIPSYMA